MTTPAERIEAMRQRAKAAAERLAREQERLEEDRKQAKAVQRALFDELYAALRELRGLPIRFNGKADHVHVGTMAIDYDTLEPLRVWLAPHSSQGTALIIFDVVASASPTVVMITHDDDEVDMGVALDLATAVVEALFDCGDDDNRPTAEEWIEQERQRVAQMEADPAVFNNDLPF